MELQTQFATDFSPPINDYLLRISDSQGIEPSLLLKRTLLQLPKFTKNELNKVETIWSEVKNVARRIKVRREKQSVFPPSDSPSSTLRALELKSVPELIAEIIHENYHYIGSHRPDSSYLGLYPREGLQEFPVSLLTLSAFDLNHLRSYLPKGVKPEEVLVVSRIYSFDGAPKNVTSFLLASLSHWLRRNNPSIKMILTYLNPNVGFTGVSLRASNWFLLGRESPISYAYVDGKYTTLRELIKQFGFENLSQTYNPLGKRLTFSLQPLSPLEIYSYFIHRGVRTDAAFSGRLIVKTPTIA